MADKDPSALPSERMLVAFSRLRESANQLKRPSDELEAAVRAIEHRLDQLKLRVACWTLLSEWQADDRDEFSRDYVGYIETAKDWHIAVKTAEGYDSWPEGVTNTIWRFDHAPQYLRIKAVEKLPELINALADTVESTTTRLKKTVGAAQELAAVVAGHTGKKARS